MALFNELQAGRFNRALQKLVGIKGRAAVRQLGTEILPVFPMQLGVEFRYLEQWNRFAIAAFSAGAAANLSWMQLRNPPTSNVIGVVELLDLFGQTATALNVLLSGQTTDGSLLAGNRLDPRGNPAASLIFSTGNTLGGKTGNIIFQTPISSSTFLFKQIVTANQEIPILPGDALVIQGNVVNTGTGVHNLIWRERFLEDSERT